MKKLIIVNEIEPQEVDNETCMGYVAVPINQLCVKDAASWPHAAHIAHEIAKPSPITEVIGQVVEGILFQRNSRRNRYFLLEKRYFPQDASKAIRGQQFWMNRIYSPITVQNCLI